MIDGSVQYYDALRKKVDKINKCLEGKSICFCMCALKISIRTVIEKNEENRKDIIESFKRFISELEDEW